jgi:lipoprotein-anchoring transpeptidase ErfK/SrfK
VSDELTRELKELAADAETPAPVAGVEVRRVAVRRRLRRRATAVVVGATAASALALLLALNLTGGGPHERRSPVARPGVTPNSTSAPSATSTPSASAPAEATVDLSRRVLVTEGRSLPVTSGSPEAPTPTGRLTVVAKSASRVMPADAVGLGDGYELKVPWALELRTEDGATTFIAAITYDEKAPGTRDTTTGWIGLRPADAEWLYGRLRVGAVVDVQSAGPIATATPLRPSDTSGGSGTQRQR